MSLAALRLRVESEREELLARFIEWLDDPRYRLGGESTEKRTDWLTRLREYPATWEALHRAERELAGEQDGERRRRAS